MANNGHHYAEIFNRLGETVLETTKQIAEINVRAGEKLLEQQAELASQWVNAATRNVDLAAKAIGYQELLTGQSQIAQEYGQQVLANYRRAAEVVNEASKQVAEKVGEAVRSTSDEVRQTSREAGREGREQRPQ
ncbi:MAG: phasin family protein [Gammaproteobacteria bacterium]|nr:phasin family protein [Gammaproteobacteria bacterium]